MFTKINLIIAAAAHDASTDAATNIPIIGPIIDEFHIDAPMLFAQMVNFLVVAYILYRFAFRPIMDIIDQRRKEISDGLQYAEEMKHKLAEAEKKYAETLKKGSQEAQRTMDDARVHAQELMEKHTQESTRRAEDILSNAKNAAVLERDKLMQEAHLELKELVVATTSKVLRKELTDDERARYTDAAAKELAGKN